MNFPQLCPIRSTKPQSARQKTEAKVLKTMCCAAGIALTTREVSDRCDISIYAARNWLLRLEEQNKVYSKYKDKKTTLWYFKPAARHCHQASAQSENSGPAARKA